MGALRLVLGDQLDKSLASLRDLDPQHDIVFLCEVHAEATYVKHHKKKIAFLFSAMRHFAEELRADGITVHYTKLDDPDNAGSFTRELERQIALHRPEKLVLTEPGEWRVLQEMRSWQSLFGIDVDIFSDDRFVASLAEFRDWAKGRKSLRMEYFYREMRKKTRLLMSGDQPVGGEWNYDKDNRKSLPDGSAIPTRSVFEPDAITHDVLALVDAHFAEHFGDLEPFGYAVTRADALQALEEFVEQALPDFGDYQDAMKQGEPFLYHSLISAYLNAGLLRPLECCERVVQAYQSGAAPLNAVEGFIRQIIGWREYVRGLYWLKMPSYRETNFLKADRDVPGFYWTADTQLNCLRQSILETKAHAYAHHIQRLMVIGNFALLAGLNPRQVQDWYLLVYSDAYEWVELPNVHGMTLFADGGVLASKPYAASGAYIDRMSDYCKDCSYHVKKKAGESACPFNYLYWDFLIRNADVLSKNPRVAMPYRTLAKMTDERKREIQSDADRFLSALS